MSRNSLSLPPANLKAWVNTHPLLFPLPSVVEGPCHRVNRRSPIDLGETFGPRDGGVKKTRAEQEDPGDRLSRVGPCADRLSCRSDRFTLG
jgi:hypothetical protein